MLGTRREPGQVVEERRFEVGLRDVDRATRSVPTAVVGAAGSTARRMRSGERHVARRAAREASKRKVGMVPQVGRSRDCLTVEDGLNPCEQLLGNDRLKAPMPPLRPPFRGR